MFFVHSWRTSYLAENYHVYAMVLLIDRESEKYYLQCSVKEDNTQSSPEGSRTREQVKIQQSASQLSWTQAARLL